MFVNAFWKEHVYRLLQIIFAHPPQETNQISKQIIPLKKISVGFAKYECSKKKAKLVIQIQDNIKNTKS